MCCIAFVTRNKSAIARQIARQFADRVQPSERFALTALATRDWRELVTRHREMTHRLSCFSCRVQLTSRFKLI